MSPAPDDHDRRGALPRDPSCHWCDPHPAHLLPCDLCACDDGAVALGIDTALEDPHDRNRC